MKVKKLIKELKKCNPDSEVILAKDEDGNGFSPLVEIDGENCVYTADSTYSGELFDCRWTANEACLEEKEYKEMLKKKRAVFLWPVN